MPKVATNRRGISQKRTAKSPALAKSKTRKTPKRKATKKGVTSQAVEQPSPEEEAAFAEAMIQSGQAARVDREGKLPAGATHKIVEDPAGHIKVVRRRFSMT
ncbi:MAG TPA: hypothetical protein VMO26_01765 [Vicinamibacterales bacterium]|nr:hypothetical protein [Vicinamibacterales bacterium]